MLVPFQTLPSNSRIWIYQSSRVLTEDEKNMLKAETDAFLTQWTAHGQTLQAAVELRFDRFLIIGANEEVNEASGCSIDKSVNFIRHLENRFNTTFLDRSVVAYQIDGNIATMDFRAMKASLSDHNFTPQTEIFDNSIQFKKELDTRWIVPIAESWLGRSLIKN